MVLGCRGRTRFRSPVGLRSLTMVRSRAKWTIGPVRSPAVAVRARAVEVLASVRAAGEAIRAGLMDRTALVGPAGAGGIGWCRCWWWGCCW